MKPKHQRLTFIAISMIFLCVAVLLTLQAFKENLVFFYSPSDLSAKAVAADQTIRIGGLVETGSIQHGEGDLITFTVTDGTSSITVAYRGLLPNLFREGQGIVAEGRLANPTRFEAKTILAKHDETYIPREVVDSLKKTGHWKGGQSPQP
jgi:cytochrome c-type biogenesis protein CcmE